MELRFTPRTVKEIEDRSKKPITDVVGDFSVTNLALLIEKGGKFDNENQALDAMEKHFEEGNDMMGLFLDIMDKLQSAGFLPKALDLAKIRATIEDPERVQETINQAMDSSVANG